MVITEYTVFVTLDQEGNILNMIIRRSERDVIFHSLNNTIITTYFSFNFARYCYFYSFKKQQHRNIVIIISLFLFHLKFFLIIIFRA